MKPRAVLDTNVFISAVLFGGVSSKLVSLWQKGAFVYLVSRPILDEYVRVLAYPKFDLTPREIEALIEVELLPFVQVVPDKTVRVPSCRDKDDEKFLRASLIGRADFLVSGDLDLLALKGVGKLRLMTPAEFLSNLVTSLPTH